MKNLSKAESSPLPSKVEKTAEDILKAKLKNIHFINSDETYALVIEAMKEYAAQFKSPSSPLNPSGVDLEERWISVDDRLPDQSLRNIDVWMDKDGGYRFANFPLLQSIYDEVDRIKEDFKINKVTHWRPLPEPPVKKDFNKVDI